MIALKVKKKRKKKSKRIVEDSEYQVSRKDIGLWSQNTQRGTQQSPGYLFH